jgi:diguanylate cyclase (GGDEF)-like protein/PAS domain S-box-containing protein
MPSRVRDNLIQDNPGRQSDAPGTEEAGAVTHATQSSSEQKLKAIWELAGDAMVFLDADGLLDCNDAALRLLGIDSSEHAVGMALSTFAPRYQADGRPSAQVFSEGRLKVIASGVERFEWEFRRSNGETLLLDVILHGVHMGGGQIVHGILRDVTAQRLAAREVDIARLAAESSLRHLSRQDALTALPNRSLFLEEGQRRLDTAGDPERVCLLCVDVDNFRGVNDALGEVIGDGALREIGERLRRLVGAADLLARLGSDEFALLLTDCSADESVEIARRLIAEQEQPFAVDEHAFSITVSVGIAHLGAAPPSLEALMQQAATAMNVARQSGRGSWRMFAETMKAGMRDRWQLESELRSAIRERQLVLHYQPQVDLNSNRVVGVEALLRWHNPRLGFLEPERFVALAEESGLIESIGEWILFEACRQSRRWLAKGLRPVRMSVNVVARQFQEELPALVERALVEAGISPEWLTLEMVESTLMDHSSKTIDILSALREQGVALAIDDFGTGYSSLSYLKRFPLDHLKIDQSLIHGIEHHADDLAIVGAVINLGHTLRLTVVAEGVENAAQVDLLRQHGCDQAQGFHFARALPAADAEVLLARSALR